jgi:hypothetical protein
VTEPHKPPERSNAQRMPFERHTKQVRRLGDGDLGITLDDMEYAMHPAEGKILARMILEIVDAR